MAGMLPGAGYALVRWQGETAGKARSGTGADRQFVRDYYGSRPAAISRRPAGYGNRDVTFWCNVRRRRGDRARTGTGSGPPGTAPDGSRAGRGGAYLRRDPAGQRAARGFHAGAREIPWARLVADQVAVVVRWRPLPGYCRARLFISARAIGAYLGICLVSRISGGYRFPRLAALDHDRGGRPDRDGRGRAGG